MVIEVYEALKGAGVSEKKAIRASEVLSKNETLTKSDIAMLERQILLVQSEQKLMKWMLGLVLIAVMMPLLRNMLA